MNEIQIALVQTILEGRKSQCGNLDLARMVVLRAQQLVPEITTSEAFDLAAGAFSFIEKNTSHIFSASDFQQKSEREREKYSRRYIAFVDVLGWKSVVDQIGTEFDRFESILGAYQSISSTKATEHWLGAIKDMGGYQPISVTIASDSIILSVPQGSQSALMLLDRCGKLCGSLLRRGFLTRGAIVVGEIFHEEDIVFGKGLTAAYILEQSCARYPRVIVSLEFIEELKRGPIGPGSWKGAMLKSTLKQDQDAFWRLNLFPPLTIPDELSLSAYLEQVAETLARGLAEHEPDSEPFAKHAWLAIEYNQSLKYAIETGSFKKDKASFIDVETMQLRR